ncbi:MAG: single-stranded DNA-binding protein [Actinomycetota bacterium]|nr:single-stranded DNA-binding protein [Actinomycetota bacterium]
MSNGPNNVTVAGNLTKDPELRFLPSGQATTSFSLAVNRSWQNQATREWEEETCYVDVVCWGDLAQNVAESASRGNRCVVSGRLGQRSWENAEGQKRSKVEITADDVALSLRFATGQMTKATRAAAGTSPAA